jgi:hypothetical protein
LSVIQLLAEDRGNISDRSSPKAFETDKANAGNEIGNAKKPAARQKSNRQRADRDSTTRA